jgi:hypothetical protein
LAWTGPREPVIRLSTATPEPPFLLRVWLSQAEGEGFEPSPDDTARNGFRLNGAAPESNRPIDGPFAVTSFFDNSGTLYKGIVHNCAVPSRSPRSTRRKGSP